VSHVSSLSIRSARQNHRRGPERLRAALVTRDRHAKRRNERERFARSRRDGAEGKRDGKTNSGQTGWVGRGGQAGEKIERRTCPLVHQPSVIRATDRLCRCALFPAVPSASPSSCTRAYHVASHLFTLTQYLLGRIGESAYSHHSRAARQPTISGRPPAFAVLAVVFATTTTTMTMMSPGASNEGHPLVFGIKTRVGHALVIFFLLVRGAPDALLSPRQSRHRPSWNFLFRSVTAIGHGHVVNPRTSYITPSLNCG